MSTEVTFDKVVPEGKAMGFVGKAVFAIGPLPGEIANVEFTREHRRWTDARVLDYISISDRRHGEREDHAQSCSPWSDVDYEYQIQLKQQMLQEIYAKPGIELRLNDFVPSPVTSAYRNKLEFSCLDVDGVMNLAFHERGRYDAYLLAPVGCQLGSSAMNRVALSLTKLLNALELGAAVETLTVREDTNGNVIVSLKSGTKRKSFSRLRDQWNDIEGLIGINVYTRQDNGQQDVIFVDGILELTDSISGLNMTYPYNAFAQVNVAAFSRALQAIQAAVPDNSTVVDLYCGAGVIGLTLAAKARSVVGVEIHADAAELAVRNATLNHISNYQAITRAAERDTTDVVAGANVVIVDPPRAGLHPKVVRALLEVMPETIVYLSCNPVTQARDVEALLSGYNAERPTGFDFYPGTLHMESLIILKRKQV